MRLRQATLLDTADVAGLLTAAALKLVADGQALWTPSEIGAAAIDPHIRAGMYFMGVDENDRMLGVFRFQLEDLHFWPEMVDESSAFVHKLALHPRHQGHNASHELLSLALGLARAHHRRHLRLDCMGGRPRLKAVYERFGFRQHSTIHLGGMTFDRLEIEVSQAV